MTAYPTRARILDVEGEPVPIPALADAGITCRTPEVSKPHVGKEGLAERIKGRVRITLDDGAVLWGEECWWEPIADRARVAQ